MTKNMSALSNLLKAIVQYVQLSFPERFVTLTSTSLKSSDRDSSLNLNHTKTLILSYSIITPLLLVSYLFFPSYTVGKK